MHFADLVRNAGIKKHPLADGRLAGINVRDDADVPNFFDRISSTHNFHDAPARRNGSKISIGCGRVQIIDASDLTTIFDMIRWSYNGFGLDG